MAMELLRSFGSLRSAVKQNSAPKPQALCEAVAKVKQPELLIPAEPEIEFMRLPSNVRRIATQRRDFCKSVCLTARAMGIPRKQACEIVIARDGQLYGELLRKGKLGSSSLCYKNFVRWMARLGAARGTEANWQNLLAIADRYIGHGRPAQLDSQEGQQFLKIFAANYEHRNRLSMKESYRLAVGSARLAGMHPETLPTYEQIAYHYANKVDKVGVLQARMGAEWAENHLANWITRDWGSVPVGDLWFGDHHVFDAPCKIYDETKQAWKAERPWLTGWLDAKSFYLAGWIIRAGEHPDSLAIEDALLHGIRLNGNRVPSTLYTDNGKDYLSKGFAEPIITPDGTKHSISRELSCEVIHALPYNARAKTIERFFRNVAGSFARYWLAYLGNRPGARPETAQYYWTHPETLPTLQEFAKAFAWWLENVWNLSGNEDSEITGGKCPAEAWGTRPELRPVMTDPALYMAFLKPLGTRTVTRGARISVNGIDYQSDALFPFWNKQVLVKLDRFDISHIYAFHFNGAPIGEVKRVKPLPAIHANPEELSEEMARNRRMLRHSRELHQERTGEKRIGAPISRIAIAQGEPDDDTAAIIPAPVRHDDAPPTAPIDPAMAADIALIDELKHGEQEATDETQTADIDLLEQILKEERDHE